MTAKERKIASHLISKIDSQGKYSKEIGISYSLETPKNRTSKEHNQKKK